MRLGTLLSWLLPLALFLAVFFALFFLRYPWIGHDYAAQLPFVLAAVKHLRLNGFVPLDFTAQLCGGIPIYGNPLDLTLSPLPLFALVFSPWVAALWTTGLFLLLGYGGWLLFARGVLKLTKPWSHILALVVIANGFHFMHAIVGHTGYLPFPLLGFLMWLLFDRSRDTLRFLLVRSVLFAFTILLIIMSAGFYVLLLLPFVLAVFSPVILLSERPLAYGKTVLLRLTCFAGASILLAASKLVAIAGFLGHFPRTVPIPDLLFNPVLFAARSLWSLPQSLWLFLEVPWGLHETSMFLSPVTFLGIAGGLPFVLRAEGRTKKVAFAAVSLFLVLLFLLIIRGVGPLPDFLHSLPIGKSIRVVPRFLYPLSLGVSALGVALFARASGEIFSLKAQPAALFASLLTVAAFAGAYFATPYQLWLTMKDTDLRRIALSIDRPVDRVTAGFARFNGATSLHCKEDAILSWAGSPAQNVLVEGPVTLEWDGAFNLMNPTCYIDPTLNGCGGTLSRISIADRENFERFRRGLPTTWVKPLRQRIADGVTVVSIIVFLSAAVWAMGKKGGTLLRQGFGGQEGDKGVKRVMRGQWTVISDKTHD